MNKIKLLVIVSTGLLLANIILLGLFVFRPKPTAGHHLFREPRFFIIEKLGLDEGQQVQFEKLVQIHRSQVSSINKELNQSRRELMSTLCQSKHNLNIDSLKNEIAACLMKIENTRYDHFASIKKICRPDQLDEFEELMDDLPKMMGGGPGPMNIPLDSDRMEPPSPRPEMNETQK